MKNERKKQVLAPVFVTIFFYIALSMNYSN